MGFVDDIAIGLADPACTRRPLLKSTVTSQAANGWTSLWRAAGDPPQAAIPGAAAIPTKSTTGAAINFANAGAGKTRYLAHADLTCSNASTVIAIVDRLAHMGGLVGNVTTVQTVGIDVNSLKGTRCANDVSDVRWWLEIYTAIGTTATTGSIVYVSDTDGSTQTITGFAVGGASQLNAANRIFPVFPLAGHPIRSITSFQQVATTGTAGSYGFAATRILGIVGTKAVNVGENRDWAQLPITALHNDTCIAFITQNGTTSSGNIFGLISLPEITTPA